MMHPSRRQFLRASGVAVCLPFLESLHAGQATPADSVRRRMVAINVGLGLHAANIIPEQAGSDYELPAYLDVIRDYRDSFTVISGCSHPDVGGGHFSEKSYLTAAKHPNSAGFRNTISLDQYAAEKLGTETRFASLTLAESSRGLSWSRSGVEIPAQSRPSRVFEQLFLEGKASEREQQKQKLQDEQSILDVVMDQSKSLERNLSGRDRDKLDQYFTAVRETERRLVKAEEWTGIPKPQVEHKPPRDQNDATEIIERMGLMYDMMHLAIETDSTRFLTYFINGFNAVPKISGISVDYHNLSHHGRDPEKIAQLTVVESKLFESLGGFLTKLSASREGDDSLLDRTMILFGSNLGNASSHDSRNMPIVLAGGGFRHGRHLAFDRDNNYPLPNLFVSMLQRLGLEEDSFASSTGTMTGLEMKA